MYALHTLICVDQRRSEMTGLEMSASMLPRHTEQSERGNRPRLWRRRDVAGDIYRRLARTEFPETQHSVNTGQNRGKVQG